MPNLNKPPASQIYANETRPGADGRPYSRLRDRGKAATLRGDFREALDCYSRARDLVVAEGDTERVDEADLNIAMVLIQMGEARQGEDGLREILLRARDTRVGVAAAYNLASSLRQQGRHDRAKVYANRALERARKLKATDCLAMIHNLLGNLYLSQSYLDEALPEYETALALHESEEGDTRYSRAIVLENLGYCLLLQNRLDEGTVHLREALDLARQVDDRRCQAECLQDLCYGHLLQDDFDVAVEHGQAALALADGAEYRDIAENCHYLLGELGSRMGELGQRDVHFQSLQSLHPELPFLKDFLCAVDVTQIITLKR
jgi:tetratricopeptide (TPR) repeat protein